MKKRGYRIQTGNVTKMELTSSTLSSCSETHALGKKSTVPDPLAVGLLVADPLEVGLLVADPLAVGLLVVDPMVMGLPVADPMATEFYCRFAKA